MPKLKRKGVKKVAVAKLIDQFPNVVPIEVLKLKNNKSIRPLSTPTSNQMHEIQDFDKRREGYEAFEPIEWEES